MGWGDEIMVTGLARQLQEVNPLPVRVLDRRGKTRWHAIWEGNPRIAAPGFRGEVQPITNGPERRPYIKEETLHRWVWREWTCPVGEIYLTAEERAFGNSFPGRVILEPILKPEANPNKRWNWSNWDTLARLLRQRGYAVAQMAPPKTPLLTGVEWIRTSSFRQAAAVLARSRMAILPEGGLHHAAAALRVPAVVLFGGYISPRQTGYSHQINLYHGGEPCGMKVRCHHCVKAMNAIRPEHVLDHVLAIDA